MLTKEEIKVFLEADAGSLAKRQARTGEAYYEGRHDILRYRMFYFDDNGNLVEDTERTNAKIPHRFFTELVDQATQLIMSDKSGFVMSDDPKLQAELDKYFNSNKRFKVELSDTITGLQVKGWDYIHTYIGKDDRLCFENADSLGVVEVEGRFADDGKNQIIWKYKDRIDKAGKMQFKVLVVDDENTYYYKQEDNGEIVDDDSVQINPRPHAVYKDADGNLSSKNLGFLPFHRIDYNKKQLSHLHTVKLLIDDYDMMSCGLSNNIGDFDNPIYVVKGFEGQSMEELTTNLRTKRRIGVPDEGNAGLEVHTIAIPYEARKTKIDIDETNIYRFGMGLNLSGMKDTNATTNIAIKQSYSLLEMRCSKIIDQLELLLSDLVEIVIAEINEKNGTGYTADQVYIDINPELMANAGENADIRLKEAQIRQTDINTLLALAAYMDNDLILQQICEVLDLDYEDIKGKLLDPDEAAAGVNSAGKALDGIEPEGDAGGEVIE